MANDVFFIKLGDLLPLLVVAPKDAAGVGVTFPGGSTATFSMWDANTGTYKITAATATIGTGADGKSTLSYTWSGTNTNTAGQYGGQFVVTSSSKAETFPTPRHLRILVDATQA